MKSTVVFGLGYVYGLGFRRSEEARTPSRCLFGGIDNRSVSVLGAVLPFDALGLALVK